MGRTGLTTSGTSAQVGPSAGNHNRTSYVRLMTGLAQLSATGVVTIKFRRRSRQIFLLGGKPVAYRSDLPEEIVEKTLVSSNLVPADRLKWMKDRLADGENLTEALVMSGALSESALAEHLVSQTRIGLGASLAWASGEWSFKPHPKVIAGQIDPDLVARMEILPTLWSGVRQYVSMEDILSEVSDPRLGNILPTEALESSFSLLALDQPQANLIEALGTGCTLDELFTRISDTTGTLVKLVWFLTETELLRWEHGSRTSAISMIQDAETGEAPEAPAPQTSTRRDASRNSGSRPARDGGARDSSAERPRARKGRSPGPSSSRQSRDVNKVIANDYRRMDRDFFGFLGIPQDASNDQIRLQCKRVAKRWQTAKANPGLTSEALNQVTDLIAGASLVWRTLSDRTSLQEYKKRAASGRAPTVRGALPTTLADRDKGAPLEVPEESGPASTSTAPAVDSEFSRARELIEAEQFTAAIPLLQRARMDNPSDPDTLADLGWAIFRTIGPGHPDDEDRPEDFVRLALTFEPRNKRALEYWARMAIESGDVDEARRRLKGLVKMQPETGWAQLLLESEAALQKAVDDASRRRRTL